jgi:poly(3-hydroxybutyrate) depolymerase
MAVIVAGAYPEIFAAVGVHSGLPRGAASNVYEALAVMMGGGLGTQQWSERASLATRGVPPQAPRPMPTIVFHGDRDARVHPLNGEHIIDAVLDSAAACTGRPRVYGADPAQVELGMSPQGRRYTRSTHRGDNGHALTEHWLVHGGGHAWSGGMAEGSYTEADGPDATHAMVRFFFTHPRGLAC